MNPVIYIKTTENIFRFKENSASSAPWILSILSPIWIKTKEDSMSKKKGS